MSIQLNLTSTWVSLECKTTAEVEGCIATICRVEVPPYFHVGCFRYKDVPEVIFPLDCFQQTVGDELQLVFFAAEELQTEKLEVEIISW